jgi:choline dehydrogenase
MADVVPPFDNHLPVRIRFGDDVARLLPSAIEDLGAARVLVVLDQGLEEHNPAAAAALAGLAGRSTLSVARFEKPAGEPTIAMVDSAIAALSHTRPEVIVAVGGGSVIDTAKAARLCAQQGFTFRDFLSSPRPYPAPEIPLIALPTSAGTGSEVSGGAVVSDPAAGRKAGIAHPHLRAQIALVDPVLTYSMPPSMTANTGVDALAQAIAGMIAKVRTPVADAIALEAIRLMGSSLVAAFRDGADVVARSRMSCASMMAGLTMNLSDCTAEHSLGQAIGGISGAPHGLTVGVVLTQTLDRERHHCAAQLERVADALGAPPDSSGDGSRAVRAVERILAELDFPVLSRLGISADDVGRMTDLALDDYFITMSPSPWTRDEVSGAFEAALRVRSRTPALAPMVRWRRSVGGASGDDLRG